MNIDRMFNHGQVLGRATLMATAGVMGGIANKISGTSDWSNLTSTRISSPLLMAPYLLLELLNLILAVSLLLGHLTKNSIILLLQG